MRLCTLLESTPYRFRGLSTRQLVQRIACQLLLNASRDTIDTTATCFRRDLRRAALGHSRAHHRVETISLVRCALTRAACTIGNVYGSLDRSGPASHLRPSQNAVGLTRAHPRGAAASCLGSGGCRD